MTGRTISHYEILERLGAGAMGVVYKARDLRLGRTVAIKFLAPHLYESKAARDRFLTEARAISSLNHPNIATLYEVGEEEGEVFLVFEYLPGGTLRNQIDDARTKGGKMGLAEALACAEGLTAGLACADEQHVLHRDIKPANLMFSTEGALKITDFGLSKFLEDTQATRSDGRVGTAAYMSPEQARGLDLDHRSDIFSAGVVIYEMLAGQPAFSGARDTLLERKIVEEDPPRLAQLRPEAPLVLVRVVEHALEKDRAKRYAHAAEMLADLRTVKRAMENPAVNIRSVALLPRRRKPPGSLVLALLACLLITAPFLSPVFRSWISHPFGSNVPRQERLAVLPFANMGADQTFCDGLMEVVTSKLGQLEQFHGSLAVVPASEVRSEKTNSGDAARRVFGSNIVLTGSVERLGDDVRLIVNLSSTQPEKLLKTKIITAKWENLLALQDSIVEEVTGLLNLELGGPAKGLLSAGETSVSSAYRLYVEALGYMSRFDSPGNLDKAVDRLNEALAADPHYPLALAELGDAYMIRWTITKDRLWLTESHALAERALEYDSRLAKAHAVVGAFYAQTGDYPKAIEEYKRAMELDPFGEGALRNLADAYQAMGKPDEAELLFKKVIGMRPNDWVGYHLLGYFYLQESRYSDAEPMFRKVTELAPGNPFAQEGLGGSLSYLGRYAEAQAVFEKAIQAQPTAALWTDLGAVLYNQGKFLAAARASEKALEYDKTNYQFIGNLADCYRWTDEYRNRAAGLYMEAIHLAESVLEVNPKDGTAFSDLAVYRAKLGDYPRAIDDIGRAKALAPSDSSVLYKAGIVYNLAGRPKEALDALEQAIKLHYSISDLRTEPELANLRKEPRFNKLLVKPTGK